MQIQAPWSKLQIRNLRRWQAAGWVHEMTGARGQTLIPTEAGWVEFVGGPVVQTWAHDFQLDGSVIQKGPPIKALGRR